MNVLDLINGKVGYDKEGQILWVFDKSGGIKMLAELRGWGRIQQMFIKKEKNGGEYIDEDAAGKFQDMVGEWIADAINEKAERT